MTLKQGSKLKGNSIRYVIESVLGQGSFGVTYKAKGYSKVKGAFGDMEVELPQPIAIKEFFMRDVNQRDEDGSVTGLTKGSLAYNYAIKFRKEAERLAVMQHPNIVRVMDFVEANNTFYYVMDFIEGENLNDYLKHHKMSEKEATDTIIEVAKALKYMHEEKHMLHLDLKPGNIMRRNNDGHIFLIDFGLSKHYNESGEPETSTSVGLGTPGYAPIEQANSHNSKLFRETLDIYALGATFYKLLTSQAPPPASELVSDDELISSELNRFGISQTLISAIVHSMTPNVKKRTDTVEHFISDLSFSSGIIKDNRISTIKDEDTTIAEDISEQLINEHSMDIVPEDSNIRDYYRQEVSIENEDNGLIGYFTKYRSYFYLVFLSIVPFFIFHLTTALYMAVFVLFVFIVYKNLSDGNK